MVSAVFLGALLMSVLYLAGGHCEASQPADQSVLRVGGNADFMPFEFINSEGRPDGYTIDLILAVAKALDLKMDISLGIWSQMRQKLETGQIDVLPGVLYSKERDQVFDFSVPHIVFSYSVFIRRNTHYQSIMDLKDKAVVVVSDVYAHDWLRANEFTQDITTVDSPQTALQLISQGKNDFTILPQLHGLDLLRRLKITNVKTFGPPVLTQKFCFAVAAGNADLLARLNEGLQLVQKSGDYDRIFLKWFSIYEQKQRLLSYFLRAFLAVLGVVVIVLLWNLSLKKTVLLKTRALTEKEILLRQIIQGLPVPTFVIDHNRNILYWNRACERLTGTFSSQVLGTSKYKTVLYNDQHTALSDILLSWGDGGGLSDRLYALKCRPSGLVEGGCESEMFFSHLGVDGKWLLGTAALIRDATGQLIGVIESWQDLTEHKRLQFQLIQNQKMEAIGTLAGGIAHDFGNILTAILGHTEMVRRRSIKGADFDESLLHIMKACSHGKDLIRRLMLFSKPSEQTIVPTRIDRIVNEAIDLVRSTLPSSIQIHCHIDSLAIVAVDATQLTQVVLNLCTNAAQAMKEKAGKLTIRLTHATNPEINDLSLDRDPGNTDFIKLSVSDTGHGIPADILQRVFEPFFSTKAQNGGSGMGLAISHSIIKSFGGYIQVKSRPGQGAEFSVFLPVVQVASERSDIGDTNNCEELRSARSSNAE